MEDIVRYGERAGRGMENTGNALIREGLAEKVRCACSKEESQERLEGVRSSNLEGSWRPR